MPHRFAIRAVIAGSVLAITTGIHPSAASAAPTAQWSIATPLPYPLQEVGSVAMGTDVYVAGGIGLGTGPSLEQVIFSNSHLRLDTRNGTWRQLTPMPITQHHLQGVVVDGKIYYLGGEEGPALLPNGRVFAYDPATDRFTERARMPSARIRGAAGIAVHDNKIYVAGGYNGLLAALPYFDVYDPATDTWSVLPDLPNAREHLGAAVIDGEFYAVGGRFVLPTAFIRPTDVFDFATATWRSAAPIPHGRGGLGVGVIGDKIYAFGGEGLGPSFDYTDVLDTATMTWSSAPSMPNGSHGIQAAVVGDRIVVAGGAKLSVYWPMTDVQVFRP
ncbi:Kelch repeat-containing protein [Nocardia brasiliensis]|uniref:Kelch repeat-containing protein n=1 Tax=Nocardia brasiliensis TaxID=37326 RepID=UPI001893FE3D|nr:kelch-like protein [Nocardia brasiliensis]MBF6130214.1 hypothetical protein [Nocardia brasiliensis]MBF6543601.1 hypothetical protein [Nocardia brasiliensis]